MVARVHLRSFLDIPPVAEHNATDLKRFTRSLRGVVSTLDSTGDGKDLNSGLTIEQVVDKLPRGSRSVSGRHVFKMLPKIATLRDLDKWLHQYSMGELMLDKGSTPNKWERNQFKGRGPKVNNNPPTISARPASSNSEKFQLKCFVSEQTHNIFKCDTFAKRSVSERSDLVRNKGRCFRCLSGNHFSKDGKSVSKCKEINCGGTHHTLLHRSKAPSPSAHPVVLLAESRDLTPVIVTTH